LSQNTGGSSSDVWVLPLGDDRKPFPIANSRFTEDSATFSPDGRSIAYGSNEAGPYQICVQPFPPTGDKYQISRNGGGQPMWRGDGRELFFIGADAMMMATTIDTSRQFEAGVPQALFPSRSPNTVLGRRSYAVTRDGKRFLIPALQDATSSPLTVVVNWPALVQK
jgi:hypothetical protein